MRLSRSRIGGRVCQWASQTFSGELLVFVQLVVVYEPWASQRALGKTPGGVRAVARRSHVCLCLCVVDRGRRGETSSQPGGVETHTLHFPICLGWSKWIEEEKIR